MQIGQAAAASGVSAKMIRHYEAIGLVPSADRQASNYRDYDAQDLHRLTFIRRARDLGFSIDRIRDLLKLWSDRHRCSSEVKAIALAHVAEMEARIKALREMADVLHGLAHACGGDDRPECPILEGLEGRLAVADLAGSASQPPPSKTSSGNRRGSLTRSGQHGDPGSRPARQRVVPAEPRRSTS